MDRAIVAEMLRKFVPLTSRSEAEDDAIDGRLPVDSGGSVHALFRGIAGAYLPEDGLEIAGLSRLDLADV